MHQHQGRLVSTYYLITGLYRYTKKYAELALPVTNLTDFNFEAFCCQLYVAHTTYVSTVKNYTAIAFGQFSLNCIGLTDLFLTHSVHSLSVIRRPVCGPLLRFNGDRAFAPPPSLTADISRRS